MDTYVHLDWETRSEIPLDVRGLHNYASHSSTQIILGAYAEGDQKVKLWQPHLEPLPAELREALEDPFVTVCAWNAAFERSLSKYVLGIDKPAAEWFDPMVGARYLSLPGSLEDVGDILGLPDSQKKMEEGNRLVKLFTEPASLGGTETLFGISKTSYHDWNSDPADWQLFGQYNKQDVVAERALMKKMAKFPLPQSEQENWVLDQAINERGMPVDLNLIFAAQQITEKEMARLKERLRELTGLENPNSTEQMLGWLRAECGYPFSSLGKAFVSRAMVGEGSLSDLGKEVLEIRKMTSKSSVNKFTAIANNVSSDGRLRNQFVFYGAARTGRWSGRDAQLQNLPRPVKEVEDNMERAVELVQKMDIDSMIREFKNPLDVVSSVIRAGFRAPEGQHLVVADLASIETRVIGYVARCDAIQDIFRQGKDAYIIFAMRMFNKLYEEVTKDERQKAKPPVLGSGFGLGGGEEKETENGDIYRSGLWGYAQAMGIDLTKKEAHEAVRLYREMYPEVVQLWWDMQDAAVNAIRHPKQIFGVGPVAFECVGAKVLRMLLPSGRCLHYINPQVNMVERDGRHGTYKKAQVTYEGREQGTHAWSRQNLIGSHACENAVQAIARDILVHGMRLATEIGFKIVLHVHDEIGALVKDDSALGLADLVRCMSTQPPWTDGKLPLDADGYENIFYRKG